MLGPLASPCDWKMASTPVRFVVTPGGAAAAIAVRVSLDRDSTDSNEAWPVG